MEINEVRCKSALSLSRLPGLMYSLNPYRGCQHNCAYCYAPNILRIKRDHWANKIEVKKNISAILAKELKTKKPGVVGISTVTDPYQPLEKKYLCTRHCLEQLQVHDFPIHIQTKSGLVTRDLDLIAKFSQSQVMISIATIDDAQRKLLEPFSACIKERLQTLRACADAGISTAVFFGPIYPTIQKAEIPAILDRFKDAGVQEIWIDTLRLKPGIWENICRELSAYQSISHVFYKKIFQTKEYYQNIREEILKKSKERNLRIIDAF